MPVYEYRCPDCDHRTTVWQATYDERPPACSACGGTRLVRLVSRVSVVKSGHDRTSDLSWVDRNLAQRIKHKVSGKLNSGLKDAVDRMESS